MEDVKGSGVYLPPSPVVPAGHRLADRKNVELTELADEPFIDTTPGGRWCR